METFSCHDCAGVEVCLSVSGAVVSSASGITPFTCSIFSGRRSSKFGRDTRFFATTFLSCDNDGGNFGSRSKDEGETQADSTVSIRGATGWETLPSKTLCEVLASDFEELLKSLRQDGSLPLLYGILNLKNIGGLDQECLNILWIWGMQPTMMPIVISTLLNFVSFQAKKRKG